MPLPGLFVFCVLSSRGMPLNHSERHLFQPGSLGAIQCDLAVTAWCRFGRSLTANHCQWLGSHRQSDR
jgi:hypothetical protein